MLVRKEVLLTDLCEKKNTILVENLRSFTTSYSQTNSLLDFSRLSQVFWYRSEIMWRVFGALIGPVIYYKSDQVTHDQV